MKRLLLSIFLVLSGCIISCKEENTSPARSFYMGFTPFPYDISLDAVNETYANITTNGDIINHHFDNGVPWVEALSGEPFNDNILNDWNFRKERTPAGQKVYLSVAALNPDRKGLALYRGTSDNMILPAPWDTYQFNSPEVKSAYVNYCKRAIAFFEPDYFNMSIEANLLHFLSPSQWSAYVEFHEFVYVTLKGEYPELPIFCSITGAQLLDGYIDENDASLQRLAALELLEYSDLYAISFYPYMSKYLGSAYPSESFRELFRISDKPIAIAETGYPAQSFQLTVNSNSATIDSDPAKQNLYMQDLLKSCNDRKAVFVISFVVRDYDQLWEDLGSKDDITVAWRDTGLIDETGQERISFSTWRNYFDMPIRP
jgi:hypothetical protein